MINPLVLTVVLLFSNSHWQVIRSTSLTMLYIMLPKKYKYDPKFCCGQLRYWYNFVFVQLSHITGFPHTRENRKKPGNFISYTPGREMPLKFVLSFLYNFGPAFHRYGNEWLWGEYWILKGRNRSWILFHMCVWKIRLFNGILNNINHHKHGCRRYY